MVLIKVDLPRPVCPATPLAQEFSEKYAGQPWSCCVRVTLTDADDVELEAPLDELLLDLLGDAIKTDIALGVDRLLRCSICGSHCERWGPRGGKFAVRVAGEEAGEKGCGGSR